jgi:hypothetical protein
MSLHVLTEIDCNVNIDERYTITMALTISSYFFRCLGYWSVNSEDREGSMDHTVGIDRHVLERNESIPVDDQPSVCELLVVVALKCVPFW